MSTVTSPPHPLEQGSVRPAATVILVRAGQRSPEVLLLKRSAGARFMPNAYVFAGGAVDAGDAAAEVAELSADLDDGRASATLTLAAGGLSYFVAAVREAFEECGILLAYDLSGTLVELRGEDAAKILELRRRLCAGALSLLDLFRAEGWRLALDQLCYFAHWITPPGLKIRFNTRFFIARAPESQVASLVGSEMTELVWRSPREALADHVAGRILLMRATRATLGDLSGFDSVEQLMEFARRPREIATVFPEPPRDATAD